MNLLDVVLILILIVVFGSAIWLIISNRKKGKGCLGCADGCSGDCSGCFSDQRRDCGTSGKHSKKKRL